MNPDRIVLEAMIQMRNHLPGSLARTRPDGLGTRLPIRSLQSMCEKFGATWAAAYTYRNRLPSPVCDQLVGERDNSRNHLTEDELRETFKTGRTLLLALEYAPSIRSQAFHFGYLAIERGTNFSSDEITALKHACNYVAAYIYEMTEASWLEVLRQFQDHLKSPQQSAQSGTWIFRILKRLHRSTRANVSAFATIHKNDICVEYQVTGMHRGDLIAPRLLEESIPKLVRSTIARREISAWTDQDDNVLTAFVSKALGWSIRYPRVLIAVQKSGNEPIALWILGYERRRLFLDQPFRELLHEVVVQARSRANHLFQRRFQKMIVDPIFQRRDTRILPSTLFAMMPFKQPWSDRIWERMIKPIAIESGFIPTRADDLFGRDIVEDIWGSICSAEVIVADITSRNPNVFYELGIAHTLGKYVVLLTQSVDDIPFDLNRYRHIVYADNLDGYDLLTKQLRSTLLDLKSSRDPKVNADA